MILIPVIDLSAGKVVHARGGDRNRYLPLQSRLCGSSHPLEVVAGLLSLFSFRHLYIADLDAIQGKAVQQAVIAAIHRAYPSLQLWIDAGIRTLDDYRHLRAQQKGTLVAGSETLQDSEWLQKVSNSNGLVLSLDYRADRALGVSGIESRAEQWPDRVICMSLNRVGSAGGADVGRLRQLRQTAPHCSIYAAGGIRDESDLMQLRDQGIDGVLLASALHNGDLSDTQLQRFA
jgi:phosphoribosylformimino-5-aminoimidazole carboxamide ribotide isomerase